jgi:putative addiction module CopG family antidote
MDDNTISVSISDERRQFIAAELATGHYADEADVVDAALGLLETRRKICTLRTLIAEGDADIAAGRVHAYGTAEDLLQDNMSDNLDD